MSISICVELLCVFRAVHCGSVMHINSILKKIKCFWLPILASLCVRYPNYVPQTSLTVWNWLCAHSSGQAVMCRLLMSLTVLQDSCHGSGMVCWRRGSESSRLSRVKWDEKQDMVQAPTLCFMCKLAHFGSTVTNSSFWFQFSSKGLVVSKFIKISGRNTKRGWFWEFFLSLS